MSTLHFTAHVGYALRTNSDDWKLFGALRDKLNYKDRRFNFCDEGAKVIIFGKGAPSPGLLYNCGYSTMNVKAAAALMTPESVAEVEKELIEFLASLSDEYEVFKDIESWKAGGFNYYIGATS